MLEHQDGFWSRCGTGWMYLPTAACAADHLRGKTILSFGVIFIYTVIVFYESKESRVMK